MSCAVMCIWSWDASLIEVEERLLIVELVAAILASFLENIEVRIGLHRRFQTVIF